MKKTVFKVLAPVLLIVLVPMLLSACGNTLNGAGRDIESAGQKIQKTF